MKPSFIRQLEYKRPLLICMLQDINHPNDCMAIMRNAIYDGADGFYIHLDHLNPIHYNKNDLELIFDHAAEKPILVLNYRGKLTDGKSDEELVQLQLMAVESGASMCDIMADIFDPSPRQLTKKKSAVDKQKKLIDQIHNMGAEVLLSSHTGEFLSAEETLEHAKAMENRGADMIKIVVKGTTEADMQESFRITPLLKKELKIPFLHICAGQYGKIHRAMAPLFGSAFVLCVQSYTAGSFHEQVLLRAIKAVYENLDRTVSRSEWPCNE